MTTRVRPILLLLVPTAVVLATALVLVERWSDRLPSPLAMHWDGSGDVDGTGSLRGLVIGVTIASVLVVVALALVIAMSRTLDLILVRTAVGFGVWISTFLPLMLLATAAPQRDVAVATEVGFPILQIVAAFVAATLIAGATTVLIRGDGVPGVPPAGEAPMLDLAAGELAVWTRTTSSRWGAVTLGIVLVVGLVTAVLLWSWVLLAVFLVVALLVAGMTSWRATADSGGLRVVGVLGVPRIHVSVEAIERASVIEVDPLKDFHGWGLRWGRGGRIGVVTRRGESLLVERHGSRDLVVTIDGARTGAALLNAVRERARQS